MATALSPKIAHSHENGMSASPNGKNAHPCDVVGGKSNLQNGNHATANAADERSNEVLNEVSFTVEVGQQVALLGATGSW